ncbi:MAG: hypothetical protein ABL993_02545 [Vicinamibacterales bacterium]
MTQSLPRQGNTLRGLRQGAVSAALTLLLAGCVHAQLTRLTSNRYPPVPLGDVTVLADISELESDTLRYERLAIIDMTGSSDGLTNRSDLLRKAREEAALIGANAILVEDFDAGGFRTVSQGSAIAIRYWRVE